MKAVIITLIASLATALPAMAQVRLEVTQPNDTVLQMEELADSSWTVTLPNEKASENKLRLFTAAIGDEYFALAYSAVRGNIYRLSNGEHVRSVFGERTYLDQSEGIAIEPPSIVADTTGTGYYAHTNEIAGMTKRNFFVHLDFATNDTVEVKNVDAMNMRAPWFDSDTTIFANGYAKGWEDLWTEYDFSCIGGLHWLHQFGKSHLWLITKGGAHCLLDTSNNSVRRVAQIAHGGDTYPAKHLIGFGPRHLAIARLKDETLQLIIFKLKND